MFTRQNFTTQGAIGKLFIPFEFYVGYPGWVPFGNFIDNVDAIIRQFDFLWFYFCAKVTLALIDRQHTLNIRADCGSVIGRAFGGADFFF